MSQSPHPEQSAVNTVKALAMDAVQRAGSGHPGAPLGMADMAVTLWSRFVKVDPAAPDWADRDRLVLSAGHASMLLYALLHLAGFPLSLDDLRNFRQWARPTAGHPEIDHKLGIEMTTGPLGQGLAAGVGMAVAEAHLRARLGEGLMSHHTFGIVSDGDLMEGVGAEAASLAGHFGLGKLIYLHDDNRISIDGPTDITFSEDIARRFEAQSWHTVEVDGHDREAVAEAVAASLAEEDRPSLVLCRTHIAHGAPNMAGAAASHGQPLGDEEIRLTKEAMGHPTEPDFVVDDSVYEFFAAAMDKGRKAHTAWKGRLEAAGGDERRLWSALFTPEPVRLEGPGFEVGEKIATRASAGALFAEMAEKAPGLIGGSADLASSTKTAIDSSYLFSQGAPAARDIAFGVREHAMGAMVSGMAVHGGLKPYGSTFLAFSDYMRPAVRLSALMEAPSVWVWTHDSILLGEDGPTHQPIEHLASLRAMPGLWVIRPADANETVEAWELALNRTDGPVALVLSRQKLPTLAPVAGGVSRGGYIVRDGTDVTLIGTGSEVAVCLGAAALLAAEGVSARVVSLPCWEIFFNRPADYREGVLGSAPRVSVEAGSTFGWERVVGADGFSLGVDRFGASAPPGVLADKLGVTAEAAAELARSLIK